MEQTKEKKNDERAFNILSIFVLCIFSIVIIAEAIIVKPRIMGEADDYLLPTISIENRLSLTILPEDIEQAELDFPNMYEHFKVGYDKGSPYLASTLKGDRHAHYFGTYSMACMPIKLILKGLGINQEYTAQLTNVAFYILALLIVYFRLKQTKKNIFLALLLLAINPVVFYIIWPSAEVFIFSCVTISLVYFSNGQHKKAGIWVSIAGTLNPTVMIYGAMIIIDYFIKKVKKLKENNDTNLKKIIPREFKDIILLGLCFLPSLVPFIYNLYAFGMLNPTFGMSSLNNYWGRFFAYLFDLNFGMLPYYNILFIVFIVLGLYSIVKLNFKGILYIISFYGVLGAVSVASHINCGMSGISRYAVWIFPIAIIYIVCNIDNIIKNKTIKRIIFYCIYASVSITMLIIIRYKELSLDNNGYIYMTPIAQTVLNNFPSLYNPYESTFISRVTHTDGGYNYEKPVIYTDDEDCVRKILTDNNGANNLIEVVTGTEQEMNVLLEKIDSMKDIEGLYYIDLDKKSKIKVIKEYPTSFDPINIKNLQETSEGIYENEKSYHWASSNAEIYLKKETGKNENIKVVLGVHDALFIANKMKNLEVDIIVNDVLVKQISLIESEVIELIIDNKEVPQSDEEFYKIEIKTNGYFNPSKMPDYFGKGNSDNRNLSVQIYYIGEDI